MRYPGCNSHPEDIIKLRKNINLINRLIEILRKKTGDNKISHDLIKYVKDRPGHDRRYAIDNTKITSQLGWEPLYTFEDGIKESIEWYLSNTEWIENIASGDYIKYYEQMYNL